MLAATLFSVFASRSAGIKINVIIPFANIAKISSTPKFVVLQYLLSRNTVILMTLYILLLKGSAVIKLEHQF